MIIAVPSTFSSAHSGSAGHCRCKYLRDMTVISKSLVQWYWYHKWWCTGKFWKKTQTPLALLEQLRFTEAVVLLAVVWLALVWFSVVW